MCAVILLASGCKRVERHAPAPAPQQQRPAAAPGPGAAPGVTAGDSACLADTLPQLSVAVVGRDDCLAGADTCVRDCDGGDATACYWLGLFQQRNPSTAGSALERFLVACRAGLAIACTNYAAGTWRPDQVTAETACVRRIFERACAVDEPWGCGMLGRMMLTHAGDDAARAQGRAQLERSCQRLGGAPCKMLATYLMRGDLGPYERELIGQLLQRACDTGDDSACTDLAGAASQ